MASYEKRGKKTRVVVSVMDKGVRRKVSKTFDRKSDAKDWAMRMEIDKNDNRKIIFSNMLFTDYFHKWYIKYKSEDIRVVTLRSYAVTERVLNKLFGNVKLADLNYQLLQDRLDIYSKTHKKGTVSLLMNKIKSSLKDALFDEYISKDIYSRLKAHGDSSRRDNVLSATEFEALQDYLYKHWSDDKCNLAVLIALETGMRIGEVMMISQDEVFPEFNMIHVKESYSQFNPSDTRTKNPQSVRKIKIPTKLSEVLAKALMNEKGRIFTMTPRTLEIQQTKLMKQLDLKPISFHGLRHSHTSYLLYKGLSLEYVSKRIGHIDTTTTQKVYAHLLKEQEQSEDSEAMKILGMSPNVPKDSKKA
ncbi:site-specific integrase [Pediococcus inopinatus]|uniref:tyrosine-type recombinase/integrase n=1 Tax=Pediococcus inopinatus TaxID=114090 RepID=UPI002B25E836|nr:tyrosine-type recombinase/integrase [Pediococcus inopinatus]WPC19495.1 site-specific integrase [Pediococcus inopinatus]